MSPLVCCKFYLMVSFGIVFTIGLLARISQAQMVNLIPNKYILTSEDRNIILNCVSIGLQSNSYNVIVFSVMDKIIYNSSNPNQKGR